jgi:regulator of nucleoside diphosphate kinase
MGFLYNRATIMRKIFITQPDHQKLEALLSSEFAKVLGSAVDFDGLYSELQRAEIVGPDELPENVVAMNSTVALCDLDTGERETYTLVFPQRADIAEGRLSVLAPIGTAILGERVGADVTWRVPAGWRRLRIEEIIYQPEHESVCV